jgi:hypothetical protein
MRNILFAVLFAFSITGPFAQNSLTYQNTIRATPDNPEPLLVIEPIDIIKGVIHVNEPTHEEITIPLYNEPSKPLADRVKDRSFPSVFQAWYGIDMPEKYPMNTLEQRIEVTAKHDLFWEEPLSQLGEGVDLALGLIWDHRYHGLADNFTPTSLYQAKKNRHKMLKINPNMIFLMEIRWRDAPMSFLPEESNWWLRDENGEIVKGWLGGWEPFYKLDYTNIGFQDNVARQAKIAVESGVYDGVMLDWSGNLDIIKKVREAIGSEAPIIVNIHDDIKDGELYKEYINGSFMELNPDDDTTPVESNLRNWDNIREALVWFEENLQEPRINALEAWGHRDDLQKMRAITTLGLTHSDGYVLFADPNPLETPDHLHDWYDFWDAELGKPLGDRTDKLDGSSWREFEGGTVIYNHYGTGEVKVKFKEKRRRISDGSIGKKFKLADKDGDIFIQPQ